jgi:hypothetical protein
MKVFISYGDAADQVTALRLQALGAADGLTVYVPPAWTRRSIPGVRTLDPESDQKLRAAEVILGVVGRGLTEACREELNIGTALHKNRIVMSYPAFVPQLQLYFGPNVVEIDPLNPGDAETRIISHLKGIVGQNAKNALLALCTIALGLLLLKTFAEQD